MQKELGYSKNYILGVSLFFVFCNILLNFDNGALPACLNQIMKKLEYDKVTMGTLGGYVYLGFVVGSIANSTIFVRYLTYKQILLLSFSMNGCGALLFTWVAQYYALAFARFVCGFGTVLFCIYHPLFVQTYLKE
jgi:predicted MFS family arabinose efflux permease